MTPCGCYDLPANLQKTSDKSVQIDVRSRASGTAVRVGRGDDSVKVPGELLN